MRSLIIQTILGLLILMIAACTSDSGLPAHSITPELSPSSPSAQLTSESEPRSQPDLIISSMYLEMEGRQDQCVNAYSPYGIRVQIKNIGSTKSGPFFVDLNGSLQEVNEGLQVGESIELHFAGTIPSGQYEATVDATNQLIERREDNNTSSFQAPTPTPPPLCEVTATATP